MQMHGSIPTETQIVVQVGAIHILHNEDVLIDTVDISSHLIEILRRNLSVLVNHEPVSF